MFNWLIELFKIESEEALNTKVGYAVLCIFAVWFINCIKTRHGGVVARILGNLLAVLLLISSATWFVTGAYWYANTAITTERQVKVVDKPTDDILQGYITMQSEYTVQQGGTLVCDIYSLTEKSVTEQDIQLDEGFYGTVCVFNADDSVQHSTLTITGVTALAGAYTIKIGDTCTITVTVVDEPVSAELQVNCIPSDTALADGDTLTISVLYTGLSVENNTVAYLIDKSYVLLDNMVGVVTVESSTANVYNVSVSNVCILDKMKSAGVTVLSGSAVDGNGKPCHSMTIEVVSKQ